MIDRPRITRILIEDEDVVAVRRKDEETERMIQLTIRQLFDGWSRKSSYLKTEEDVEVDPSLFPEWFSAKYLNGKGLQNSIISIEYTRI